MAAKWPHLWRLPAPNTPKATGCDDARLGRKGGGDGRSAWVPSRRQLCTNPRRIWYSSLTQTISTHRCSFGSARMRILTSCSAETVPEVRYSLRAVENHGERGFGELTDQTITCRDCGEAFTFTAGEQAFYQERGYSEPQRCANCRAERKAQRAASGYDSGSGSSSGGYSRGGGGGGGYSSGPRQMYPTICSACGKETEVPFQPRNDKPVYCRECFQEKRAAAPSYGNRY